jgi:hypothetical protein
VNGENEINWRVGLDHSSPWNKGVCLCNIIFQNAKPTLANLNAKKK